MQSLTKKKREKQEKKKKSGAKKLNEKASGGGNDRFGTNSDILYGGPRSHLGGYEDEAGNASPLEWLSLSGCVGKLAAGSRQREIKDLHS